MTKEPTLKDVFDILEVLQAHTTYVDERFNAMDERFASMEKRFDAMDRRFEEFESKMVTKDYLDERLADLRGDMASESYRQIRKHEMRFHGA